MWLKHDKICCTDGYKNTHEKNSESHHMGNALVCCTTNEPRYLFSIPPLRVWLLVSPCPGKR